MFQLTSGFEQLPTDAFAWEYLLHLYRKLTCYQFWHTLLNVRTSEWFASYIKNVDTPLSNKFTCIKTYNTIFLTYVASS